MCSFPLMNKKCLFLMISSFLYVSNSTPTICDIDLDNVGILSLNGVSTVLNRIKNMFSEFTRTNHYVVLCRNQDILNDNFSKEAIDASIWTVQQYIPGEPDWEFNLYQNTKDVVDVVNDTLRIKPLLKVGNTKSNLDLNPGCTRAEKYCSRPYRTVWNVPVVSGKIHWNTTFYFGNVTIRAKLPIGDYIYPEIYLEDIEDPERRILIAYARGNKNYENKNGTDIGGTKLFGGPYVSVQEPIKSKYLSVYENGEHIGSSWHIFTLIWTPDNIDLFIDGTRYGHLDKQAVEATKFNQLKFVRLVLGVGVGGPYEFLDGYKSSGREKPYGSSDRNSVKQFTINKDRWYDTWDDDSQLLVDYVIIKTL